MSGPKRDAKGRIVKGQVLNPGGRPKVADEFKNKCRRIVDEHVIEAWETEVLERGDGWMKASELLAAYGYGRPKQGIEHSGPEGERLGIKVEFVRAK